MQEVKSCQNHSAICILASFVTNCTEWLKCYTGARLMYGSMLQYALDLATFAIYPCMPSGHINNLGDRASQMIFWRAPANYYACVFIFIFRTSGLGNRLKGYETHYPNPNPCSKPTTKIFRSGRSSTNNNIF